MIIIKYVNQFSVSVHNMQKSENALSAVRSLSCGQLTEIRDF